MRRADFQPGKHSRICDDHFISLDYYYPLSCRPLKTSVPSAFDFFQHLHKVVTEQKLLKRKAVHIEGKTE